MYHSHPRLCIFVGGLFDNAQRKGAQEHFVRKTISVGLSSFLQTFGDVPVNCLKLDRAHVQLAGHKF